MFGECHAHIFMNGYHYQKAVRDHGQRPQDALIRKYLQAYAEAGVAFVRDGGDNLGVSVRAKEIASEYGIDYRTPVFAIHKNGHYGGIVGKGFDTLLEYAGLVKEAAGRGADFIKIMTTGIMDFDTDGHITGEPLAKEEVREMVRIAHEEGMAVMSHTNGKRPVEEALEAGADSIEHGNYIDKETIQIMAGTGAVWVPTLATVANLIGSGRFGDSTIRHILEQGRENIAMAFAAGVHVGLGSDAGAFRVPHGRGICDEYALLTEISGKKQKSDCCFGTSERIIKERFRRH